jgi:ABC-2 type transport system ATP-binding protein
MSLQVSHLTRIYGQQKAVDDVTFHIERGEVVGFLGPNGAGKSTTMKMITGYLPPTEGTVSVDGLDVQTHSLAVRQRIGYLPEHNPLYLDMYVHEFLRFIGRINGMTSAQLARRVPQIIGLCGLAREQNKKLEVLSKGYRQRVGIGQALIHDPPVLILDEPTSGLDPNQILEIRKLITEVSADKTVLFSTHILQEVEALCDRVIVINRGQLVADDLVRNLLRQTKSSCIEVEFTAPVAFELLEGIPGLTRWEAINTNTFLLEGADEGALRAAVIQVAAQHRLSLSRMQQPSATLEEIFRQLTLNTPA